MGITPAASCRRMNRASRFQGGVRQCGAGSVIRVTASVATLQGWNVVMQWHSPESNLTPDEGGEYRTLD